MSCKHLLSSTPSRLTGGALWRGLAALGALVVVVFLASSLFKSDEEIVSDAVDAARDALCGDDDEAFLGFFADDLTYKDGGDLESLRRDLAQWRSSGLRKVFILDRRIEALEDRAQIHLVVAVGSAFFDGAKVDVDLEARKTDGGWRVSSFTWER